MERYILNKKKARKFQFFFLFFFLVKFKENSRVFIIMLKEILNLIRDYFIIWRECNWLRKIILGRFLYIR